MSLASQDEPYRSVEDIGIRVPVGMPIDIDPSVRRLIERLAGITRGAGIVMAAQEIAADRTSALRAILSLLKLLVFGRAQQTIDELTANSPKLGCSKGCSYCCYQSVEATVPEAILVASHLSDANDPRRAQVLDAAAALRGLSEPERRRTGRPCPLLVDGKCSVYHDRPLMCRSMFAVSSEGCRAAHVAALTGQSDVPNDYYLIVQFFLLGDQAGLRGILKDMNLQHDLVELTQAVAAILRDSTIVDRWLAGEQAFGPDIVRQ